MQNHRSIDFSTIDTDVLKRLNEMIFTVPANNRCPTTQIPTDRKIHRIPGKRLTDRNFVMITHRIATNTIDP
jgi:hypothetical protein